MPNWCYNVVKLSIPSKVKMDDLLLAIKDNKLFEKFVPLGLGFDENGEPLWKMGTAIEKWGTKWEPDSLVILNEGTIYERGNFIVELSFDTAWAPPIGFYETMWGVHGISVDAKFYEANEEVFGLCTYNSNFTKNTHYNYPRNKRQLDEIREIITINGDLDNFMESEWENLQERWQECNSEDSFE